MTCERPQAFKLADFIATIPNLEFNEPAPFKNQQGAVRVTVKTPTTNFIKVQLCEEKDALYCPFGTTRKPSSMEGKTPIFDDSKPAAYSTTIAIPPGSPQFAMFEALEAKLKEQAIKSPAWFAKLPLAKRKNPEGNMTALLKEPTPAANGEIKYPEYTLRVNTKPEAIKVFTVQNRRFVPAQKDPHLAITAKSRVIPIINLGYIYVTNMGWGVTWYLDSIIVFPGESTKSLGIEAFSGLSEDMEVDESAVVVVEQPKPQAQAPAPGVPSLQQVSGGLQALAEGNQASGSRPTMEIPFDLEDVLMDV